MERQPGCWPGCRQGARCALQYCTAHQCLFCWAGATHPCALACQKQLLILQEPGRQGRRIHWVAGQPPRRTQCPAPPQPARSVQHRLLLGAWQLCRSRGRWLGGSAPPWSCAPATCWVGCVARARSCWLQPAQAAQTPWQRRWDAAGGWEGEMAGGRGVAGDCGVAAPATRAPRANAPRAALPDRAPAGLERSGWRPARSKRRGCTAAPYNTPPPSG